MRAIRTHLVGLTIGAIIVFAAVAAAQVLTRPASVDRAAPTFRVTGSVAGLYPGVRTVLRARVVNRFDHPIRVRRVTARVRSTVQDCPTSSVRNPAVAREPAAAAARREARAAPRPHDPGRAERVPGRPLQDPLRRQGRATVSRRARIVAWLVAVAILLPGPALAAWRIAASGSGRAMADALNTGPTPSVAATGRAVTVSWSATTLGGGAAVTGYRVNRYANGSTTPETILSTCAGTITGLSCVESLVPAGSWRYRITPVRAGWTGPQGPVSALVTMNAPSFTFSSSATITTLPSVKAGSLAQFGAGETVQFRLDAPGGTLLTGSTTPATIGAAGHRDHLDDHPGRDERRRTHCVRDRVPRLAGVRHGHDRPDRTGRDRRRHPEDPRRCARLPPSGPDVPRVRERHGPQHDHDRHRQRHDHHDRDHRGGPDDGGRPLDRRRRVVRLPERVADGGGDAGRGREDVHRDGDGHARQRRDHGRVLGHHRQHRPRRIEHQRPELVGRHRRARRDRRLDHLHVHRADRPELDRLPGGPAGPRRSRSAS